MNTTNSSEALSITTLNELLASNGQQFVRSAFQTILGREPDPEGLAYYLTRLRAGYSKMRTVQQLRMSKEGYANEARLPGLDAAISRYRRGHYIAIGWLFRLIDGTESNHPIERKLRAIENNFFLLIDKNKQRFNQLDNQLIDIRNLMVEQTQSILVSNTHNANTMSALQGSLVGIHSLISQLQVQALKPEDNLNYLTIEDLIEISTFQKKSTT